MIVKMKKTTLFTVIKERDEALFILRKLGVMHVESEKTSSTDTDTLEDKISCADRALSRIGRVTHPKTLQKTPEEVIEDIFALDEEKEELLLLKEEVETQLNVFEKWSNASLQSIQDLKDSGVYVRLYSIKKKQYDGEDEEREDLYKVGEHGEDVLLAHISSTEEEKLEFQDEYLPGECRRDLLDQHYRIDEKLAVLNSKLDFLGNYELILKAYMKELQDELHFAKIEAGMGATEEICYLRGFVPYDKVGNVREVAEKHSWAYLFEDVTEEDEAPTLIRNPKWVSIIDPLLKFLGTVPGYNELDVSMWFLLFFSLFFAMLVGDAGYGLIFITITAIAQWKIKKAPRQFFILMYVLCSGTIIWGILTGNYFGSSTLGANPFLRQFVVEKIASFRADGVVSSSEESIAFMMKMCFTIGVVHLTIAHLNAAWKKINTLKCLSDFGWICILWGLFSLVCHLIFKENFPLYAAILLIVGFFPALLFANYERNGARGVKKIVLQIIKGMKNTAIELPLGIISCFSDIISYVRLFAVGYTAVVLANTFNHMAENIGDKYGVLGLIAAAMILFSGHAVNIVLSVLGVAVHGIRLKMLEFASHIGNEWTGDEYDPFKEPDKITKIGGIL